MASKRSSYCFLFLFLVASWSAVDVQAQVKLSSVYTDNMVVQQQAKVPIWGTSYAADRIMIIASWAPKDTLYTTANSSGEWRTMLETPTADFAAHTITCNTITLHNVMLGEVWLCSGQSNMAWSADNGITNTQEEIKAATYPYIRIFDVPTRAARTPQNFLDAQWTTCMPQTMRRTSAVGYFFARSLYQTMNVPIGIIVSAWGGANAETWTPMEYFDKEMLEHRVIDPHGYRPHDPALIYNQMLHPIVPYTLAGVIWYQGESNRLKAAHYDKLMRTMIGAWRARFESPTLPFYFVQIAPFLYTGDSKDTYAAELREAQQMTTDSVVNTGMVVVSDLVDNINDIHPLNKKDVGLRLADYALAEVYKKPMKGYKSPAYASMSIKGNRVTITFKTPKEKLVCSGDKVEGFSIASQEGVFVPAQAKVLGDKVEVWADGVTHPTQVRYCFDDATLGNLKSATGLPVAPFRTGK